MSASPPKANMCSATRDVRFGPIADSCTAAKSIVMLFDRLVGRGRAAHRDSGAARLIGGLEKAASRPNDDFHGLDRLVGT